MNEPTYFYQLPTFSLKFAEAPFFGKEFWPSTCAVWAVTLSQVGRVGAKPEPRWAEAPDTDPPGGLEPSAPSSFTAPSALLSSFQPDVTRACCPHLGGTFLSILKMSMPSDPKGSLSGLIQVPELLPRGWGRPAAPSSAAQRALGRNWHVWLWGGNDCAAPGPGYIPTAGPGTAAFVVASN